MSGDCLLDNGVNDLSGGIWFQSAVSGAWYRDHQATGGVSAVRVEGVHFDRRESAPTVGSEDREKYIDRLERAAREVCDSWHECGDVGAVHFAALWEAIEKQVENDV